MKLALLGTGRMGFPMARRLCQAASSSWGWFSVHSIQMRQA